MPGTVTGIAKLSLSCLENILQFFFFFKWRISWFHLSNWSLSGGGWLYNDLETSVLINSLSLACCIIENRKLTIASWALHISSENLEIIAQMI